MSEIINNNMDKKQDDYLLIIDGSSLLSTQFFGNLPKEIMFAKTTEEKEKYFPKIMQTSTGIYTNAVYGFLRALLKIMKEQKPTYLAVTWDISRNTFRREIYPDYKGNRGETLEPLKDQFKLCQQVLDEMGVVQFMDERYEADDFSGTLCQMFEEEVPIRVMTKDNDYLQLITERTNLWLIHSTAKKTDELYEKYGLSKKEVNAPDRTFVFTPELVEKEFGILPSSVPSLKGIQGDSSDNIKGVPGVGEATAVALIKEYKTVEHLYEVLNQLDEAGKKEINEYWKTLGIKRSPINALLKISDTELVGEKAAMLSKTLATIKKDIELKDLNLEQLRIQINTEKAQKCFNELEFKTLKMVNTADEAQPSDTLSFEEEKIKITSDLEEAEALFQKLIKLWEKNQKKSKKSKTNKNDNQEGSNITISEVKKPEYNSNDAVGVKLLIEDKTLVGVSIYYGQEASFIIPCEGFITSDFISTKLKELLEKKITLAIFDVKKYLPYLKAKEESTCFDVSIAGYLLEPDASTYEYQTMAEKYLELELPSEKEVAGGQTYVSLFLLDQEQYKKAACYESFVAHHAYPALINQLTKRGLLPLFEGIEMPLVYTLYDMEQRGIRVDTKGLAVYGDQLGVSIIELEKQIYEMVGGEFNINSPKQLGEILFERLGLPYGKKTKTGYSTSAEVLEKLSSEHPVIKLILQYRQLTKLKSTYADGLATYVEGDGRIHGTFNQTIAATGRLSSTEPNLQNIPIRMELGRKIRKVFIPEDGYLFLDADYSQIELRLLAHMSNDERLIDAYRQAQDIHRLTASEVFHTPFDEVTSAQRSNAKAVNFGIVYGISSFSLGQDLDITRKEAEEYISKYFMTYPRVKTYLDGLIEEGKETGVVKTLYGRIRPVPNLNNTNFMKRSAEERIAMNSPIQGTAADIMKLAMIHVNQALKERNLKSRLLLQIHDELLVETHESEVEEVAMIMKEEMQQAARLSVPLEVSVTKGTNWYEAK
ncbi:DNA polymerase I [Lachnoclostridium phytofermentans]|uniref:DNA polymerase I n=1 Tax=Lachnoclostridium phytofermentans TaxID=66219 RepID=UPI00068C292F|nr:DNA polymerase I [Lachnoclostridium phytofermentans]